MLIKEPPHNIGIEISCKTPAGTELNFKIIDEVGRICEYEKETYYKIIQVIQYDDGEYAFRIGYYRYNERLKRWIWGQYTQMINVEEWEELYKMANEKGFFSKYKNNT